MGLFVLIFLSFIAHFLVKLFGVILFPWSLVLVIYNGGWRAYWYEVSRGWDILANKLYAPAFNKKLGPGYGGDETISQRMAFNKRNKLSYPDAAKWETRINYFDKNHLDKIELN